MTHVRRRYLTRARSGSRGALRTWLPNAAPFVLPGATHMLQLQDPRGMAERLAALFARHPIAAQ